MQASYDIAVAGSGFGGSLIAAIARRLGYSVLLVERGSHPRFAIGESTSPLANLMIEQISKRYDLPALAPLSEYGRWQRTCPEIVCGLKRGFTYFHHVAGEAYEADPCGRNQLLVAASPNDDVADTHWLRSDVDHFFVRQAIAAGVDYRDHTTIQPPQRDGDGWIVRGTTETGGTIETLRTRAGLLIDATGPRGCLSRAFDIPEGAFANYPATQSLFTHFTGVPRAEDLPGYSRANSSPPYPIDDAAAHHVFDGGWMWVLRFGNGVTSAGIAAETWLADELRLSEGAPAWERLLDHFPSVRRQFESARPTRPFIYAPRLSYRAAQAAGPGWAMLPSAATFIDPLFSTGIPLTLLGIERLARILEERPDQAKRDGALHEYGTITLDEADATADFISGCYAAMRDFEVFAALSMFYFAAASYSEMARRLNQPKPGPLFLAAAHAEFGPARRACAAEARAGVQDIEAFRRKVARNIDSLNIAGLADDSKRNRYDVNFGDLIDNATKLGMTPDAMTDFCRKSGWLT